MRAGAHGFVRKDKLDRLSATVTRELHAYEERLTQRRAHQQMCRSEARHRALFTHCPLAVWAYDPQTLRIVAVNDAAVDEYRYGQDELLGLSVADLHASDGPSVGQRPPEAGRWRYRRGDGSVATAEVQTDSIRPVGERAMVIVAHVTAERAKTATGNVVILREAAPAVQGGLPPAAVPSRDSLSATLAQARVLLVEADEQILAAYRQALAEYGCAVESAPSADAAWALFDRGKVDVVVTDVATSDGRGLAFLRAVRERDLDVP